MNGQNKYYLIGKNIEYSFSREIQEKFSKINYQLLSLNEQEAKNFLLSKKYVGLNITIPYKKLAFEICDRVDEASSFTKTVNTIVYQNNRLNGYNTDCSGFLFMLNHYHIDVSNKKILILGNGATSNSIKYVLSKLNCKAINKVTRKATNEAESYEKIDKYYDYQIIINTTPVGTNPNIKESPISLDNFYNLETVIDVIYNPLFSSLLLQAKKRNIPFFGGLLMLVAQAFYSHELFINQKKDIDELKKVYYEILLNKMNIILIGMPYSGKTSTGQLLARKLNKSFIDIDEAIVNREKQSIIGIFKDNNEAYFRKIESEEITKVSLLSNQVVSTGGGVVLNENNMMNLFHNGLVIYIKRDKLTDIDFTTRPLVKNKKSFDTLYQKRYKLYEKYCNIKVENNSTIENCVEIIEREIYAYLYNQRS